MKNAPLQTLAVAGLSLVLGACGMFSKAPGTSVVQFYNNSNRTVLVEDNELRPNRQGTFKYPTESGQPLIVFWSGCVHTYIGPDRKPGEFRGTDWMLRGAYRAQLEPDGRLYLLPPGAPFPAPDAASLPQPDGFPLQPREGSSCVQ